MDFTAQLHELLKLMLNYRDAVDGLYSFSVAEFTKRQEMSARIETRTRAGRWGLTEADDDDDDPASAGNAKSKGAGRPRKGEGFDESVIPTLLPLGGGGADGERNVLEQLRQRLRSLEVDFKARVNVLLGDLACQPDVDMRFLGVMMNFNNVYSPARKRRPKVESHKPAAA